MTLCWCAIAIWTHFKSDLRAISLAVAELRIAVKMVTRFKISPTQFSTNPCQMVPAFLICREPDFATRFLVDSNDGIVWRIEVNRKRTVLRHILKTMDKFVESGHCKDPFNPQNSNLIIRLEHLRRQASQTTISTTSPG